MSNSAQRPGLTPEKYYAAVDLGSNSFHMVVVRVSHGCVHIVGKVKQKVRLAAGLDEQFYLDQASMERGWKCLEMFAERLQDIPPANIRIVGTATLRLARNAADFVQKAEQILGHPIQVISGEEEARQIYLGVAYTSANQGNSLVIDIGGASTEVILGKDFTPITLTSMELGCVTYMERHFTKGILSEQNFEAAMAAARQQIQAIKSKFSGANWRQCLGASGTPQAVTEILVAQGINDTIRLSYLVDLTNKCIACGSMDKLEINGLEESRRAVFPSGLAILRVLFEELGIEQMQISGGALREGLIYGMLENIHHNDARTRTIDSLTERFHIEEAQGHRVAETALALYRQMPPSQTACQLDAEGILLAAARLHEIGLHVDFRLSHHHGRYLLSHLSLPGFTKLQQECIRDLVYSHRQELDPDCFGGYQTDLRQVLMTLCRVLRIAYVLSIRRKDNLLPSIELQLVDEQVRLVFPEGWLKAHPLLDAELANERWLQHRMGWGLDIQ
ncbi:guanosine-5'-triphosphate,3'-diphosphate pyrophosphatase [Aliiglaciecola sp. CAU 1673]|uniref:Ppx/GppA phosphatase family protein n=1 Tax=Aliiglaciecola sp. CAU 1673 TaxID=3032595 RepID=UPI0023DC2D9F|nr:guanosine-5'-triphosphate,3'-diphosphate pyrophosphatase [Aliiglaciecola sp. CAU 1673]MDF2178740.1 guanosine-5'-triphosphate,3'-diphosphate pyrophosphatase [Aliiglaciecola sp. CAU 1673]